MHEIIELRPSEKSTGEIRYGFGYNWFDFYGMGGGYAGETELYPLATPVYPAISDKHGWEAVREGLDLLNPGIIRFGLPTDPLVGDRPGELNTKSIHFKRLEKVARWAAKKNCTVLLDTFLIPTKYGFSVPREHGRWTNMAPRDNRIYARKFIQPLLRHVVDELGLSAVKLFNPVNEPGFTGGAFQTPGNQPDAHRHYVEMYRQMREAIEADARLRDNIGLVGMDVVGPDAFFAFHSRMENLGIDLDPYVELYSVHYYWHRFDWAPPCEHVHTEPLAKVMDEMTPRMTEHCRARGKRLIAAELGNGYFGWSWKQKPGADDTGHAKPESVLLTAETAVRGLNAGLCGVIFWSFFSPDNIDGEWSIMAVKNGRLVKQGHKWHLYRLLSNAIRPGDSCFPLVVTESSPPNRHLHGSFFMAADRQTFLIINDSWCDGWNVRIKLDKTGTLSPVTKTVKDTLRTACTTSRLIPKRDSNGEYLEDIVMPMSLTVYQRTRS